MADEQNQNPVEPLTAQQIVELVNQAITGHMKRNEAKQLETFKTLIGESLKSFQPPAPVVTDDDEGKSGKKSKVDPQVAALQAKLDDLTKIAEQNADKARKAEEKAKVDNAYNALRSALAPHVRPDVVDSVSRMLFHGEQRVEFDDQGTPLFRVRRAPMPGLAEEDTLLPITDGVDFYLKSKEAAAFLPAPAPTTVAPSRGSRFPQNTQPNQTPKYDKPATTDEEKVRRAMEQEQSILRAQKQSF